MKQFIIVLLLCGLVSSNSYSQHKNEELLKQAETQIYKGDLGFAIKQCQKVLQNDSTNAEAYYFIGLAKRQTKINDGLEEFTKAIQFKPNYGEAYNQRGGIHSFNGDDSLAFIDYTSAICCDSSNSGYYFNRAETNLSLKRFDLAISDCNKSLELGTDYPPYLYVFRAKAYFAMGKVKEAFADCNKALKEDPYEKAPYRAMAEFYESQGEIDKAVKNYEKSIDFVLEEGPTYYRIAKLYVALKKEKKACENFQRAVSLGFKVESEYLKKCLD